MPTSMPRKRGSAKIRGLRQIERDLEQSRDEAAQAAYKYCLAVQSRITDDGHPPLDLGGIKLHSRLSRISDSLEEVTQKKGIGPRLQKLHSIIKHGLEATASVWPPLEKAAQDVRQTAHRLLQSQPANLPTGPF